MKENHLTLNRCRKGSRVRVVALRCGAEERQQFCGKGLVPGCRLTVVNRSSNGAAVIRTGETSLILDNISGESVICEEDHFF
jgi:Fe2+ transport system protein FeoA